MASEYERKCKLDRITEKPFKNALFGHGLQVINDEDEFEEMPYVVDDGNTILTADCILDNRDELIKEFSISDAATLVPDGRLICMAYEKWKYDFVKHIQGLFSVAVYNSVEKKLFLCTDRTSSRCLYYFKNCNSCTFSTLISPIKKLFPNIERNEMYIKDFLLIPGLMPNISSEETPWEGIFIIEAGCSVSVTEESVRAERYWEPEKQDLPRNINKLKEIFLDTYRKAVKKAIRTNAGVGMALSGGFDSASVAAMAAPQLHEQGKKIISYTYVPYYDMSKQYPKRMITNESGYVQEIAKMYPNIETNFVNNDGKSFLGYIDELLDVMEIPFKAFVNLPQLLEIYRGASARGCKIFLNGQTGNASVSFGDINETVYELYRKKQYITAIKYFDNYCKLSGISRKIAFPEEVKRIKAQKNVKNYQENLDSEDINPFVKKELLVGYSLAERNESGMIFSFDGRMIRSEDMRYEVYTLPALSYIGAMETKLGLYTGVVIRDATRDSEVLNFCYSYPFEYYSYKGVPRYLIRGFMGDFLPSCILYPILKTGIQGADWLQRLARDQDHVIKELSSYRLVDESNYLKLPEIMNAKDNLKEIFADREKSIYFFIIHVFGRYMELSQN